MSPKIHNQNNVIKIFHFQATLANSWLRPWLPFSSHTFVASLDKALYDDYLCFVVSNKQHNNWEEVKETTGKLGNG